MEKVLIIEDDPAVQRALTRLFRAEGFEAQVVRDGSESVNTFRAVAPSIVVLDLRLPGMSGRQICRELKRMAPTIPVIVLSAATDVSDKVSLLELGADDYVTKPFSPSELLARVRASLRRASRMPASTIYRFGDVTIDLDSMELRRGAAAVGLTAQEFKILKFFVEHPHHVITREQLLNEVWGYQSYPTTRTVDNHVMRLRQKIEPEPMNPVHFRTVHGVGYKFIP